MQNVIRIAKRLIPLEQIALIEPYIADPTKPLNTTKEFRSRIVLLDKNSVLAEQSVATLSEAHSFRMIQPDGSATNPDIAYWVERFQPTDAFKPEKPFQSRLLWRDPSGLAQSRLLLASPETILAIAVRGVPDPEMTTSESGPSGPEAAPRRRQRAASSRKPQLAKDPA
jgi:hypothetical protein